MFISEFDVAPLAFCDNAASAKIVYQSNSEKVSMLEVQTQLKLSDSMAENSIFHLHLFIFSQLICKKRREQGNIETLRFSNTANWDGEQKVGTGRMGGQFHDLHWLDNRDYGDHLPAAT